jgi:hypothetical protein
MAISASPRFAVGLDLASLRAGANARPSQCQKDFLAASDAKGDVRLVTPKGTSEFKMARSLSAPSQTDDASADQPRRQLRLGLRLRSVVTGAIAALGHELVELGPVLRKAQAL